MILEPKGLAARAHWMRRTRIRNVARQLLALTITVIVGVGAGDQTPALAQSQLEVLAKLQQAPGNLTVTPDGRTVLSLHQFYNPSYPVAELRTGELVRFPPNASGALSVQSTVLGLQADTAGVVWLLDNTAQSPRTPQLVAWNTRTGRLQQTISLTTATVPNSFVNDLRVNRTAEAIYISDPAGGSNAALIVVDIPSGTARRVLEGHPSVVPEEIDLFVEGNPVVRRTPEGTYQRPRIGVDAIALDAAGEWLYYGPLNGTSLYRIRTADLRNAALSPAELAARVERYSDKPLCDGILIDREGNIYLGELAANAIGVITPDRRYRRLIEDPRLRWVDDFSFSVDGKTVYVVTNKLHLSAPLNAGVEAGAPPFYLFRFRPLAPGVPGQ